MKNIKIKKKKKKKKKKIHRYTSNGYPSSIGASTIITVNLMTHGIKVKCHRP